MLPWVIATCLTPCWRKKSFISCCTFGLVVTSVATQRFMIGSAPSCRMTPAAIFVVVWSPGPYKATVPKRAGLPGSASPLLPSVTPFQDENGPVGVDRIELRAPDAEYVVQAGGGADWQEDRQAEVGGFD